MVLVASLTPHFLYFSQQRYSQFHPKHVDLRKRRREEYTNSLIHTQNQTTSLHSRLNSIDLDQTRLPNKRLHIISDTLIIEIYARPRIALSMLDAQLGQDVCGVETGVVAELAGDYLECFSEGFNYRLLFTGNGEVGGAVEMGGDLHLWGFVRWRRGSRVEGEVGTYFASTTASDNVTVLYGAFHYHYCIMETSLYFCNELLCSSSQDQSACFCCRASFEEVVSLAAYLTLLESLTGT